MHRLLLDPIAWWAARRSILASGAAPRRARPVERVPARRGTQRAALAASGSAAFPPIAHLTSWAGWPPGRPVPPMHPPAALRRLVVGGVWGAGVAMGISAASARVGAMPLALKPCVAALVGAAAAGALGILTPDDLTTRLSAAPVFFCVQAVAFTPLSAAAAGGTFTALLFAGLPEDSTPPRPPSVSGGPSLLGC